MTTHRVSGRATAAPVAPPVAAPAPRPPPGGRRLVVVSNRLPFTVERGGGEVRFRRSPGGLVAALDPVLNARGGVWVGWPGVEAEPDESTATLTPAATGRVRYRAVALTAREVSQYYSGFSNRTLWPLFHYFVARTRIDTATWRAYERVNQRFAEEAVAASMADDLIWVHDYQLLRAPLHVRQLAPQRHLAFFLHIPFPAYDVFRLLPWARPLMRGMLAADLVAFHFADYADHFLTCAERLLGCEVDRSASVAQWEGRTVSVQAHPIGIDAAAVERLAREAPPPPPPAAGAPRPRAIIAVDRLDYTKGIYERLLALERLFEEYPSYRRQVVFTQILVPSREHVDEYRALKRQIDETVGRVNGRFSDERWTPIRYLARSLAPEDLAAFYRRGDVALVTPLRDGMNLVAKEYVAAQVDDAGVLILSELAGAAQELQEALVVNPFDPDAVAETLHRALTMSPEEAQARMSALRDRVRTSNVQAWVGRFLEEAEHAAERAREHAVSPVDRVVRRLRPWLAQRPTLAVFLDYDGTLTPITTRPEDAVLSDVARETLRQGAQSPLLDLTIVSGRALSDVRRMIAIPGLTYVGNHGFEIEGPGISHRPPGLERHLAAMAAAGDALTALEIPGARVERKGATVSYHLREVPERLRPTAERKAVAALKRCHLRVTRGKLVLEGRPPLDWGKGHAVLHVLTQRHGTDWTARLRALYVGDDATDQDAFRALRGIGRSIFVGAVAPATGEHADEHLPDPAAVIQLLRRLAAGGFTEVHP
jgi:trehalose 6-phosphate synthase/phosphatase